MEKEYSKGTLIKNLREEAQLSQLELARRLGCSQQSVTIYERGLRTPSLDKLEKLSDIFNVDKYTFLPDEWQPPHLNGMPLNELIELLDIIESVLKAKNRDILLKQKLELAYLFFDELKQRPNLNNIDKVIYINDYLNQNQAVNQ